MNYRNFIKGRNGFATSIFIVFFSSVIMGLLLLYYLFTLYMSEMGAFYDDAALDCFLANKSALTELKYEYIKSGYIGDFETEACKNNLKNFLSMTFNVENTGADLMYAGSGNRFIKSIEIKEYFLNSRNEIEYTIYITARPYFNSVFFDNPVYKIKSKINIDRFSS